MLNRLHFILPPVLCFCIFGFNEVIGQPIGNTADSLRDSIEWSVLSAPVIVHATEATTPFSIHHVTHWNLKSRLPLQPHNRMQAFHFLSKSFLQAQHARTELEVCPLSQPQPC